VAEKVFKNLIFIGSLKFLNAEPGKGGTREKQRHYPHLLPTSRVIYCLGGTRVEEKSARREVLACYSVST
jgi:hypothetical protein